MEFTKRYKAGEYGETGILFSVLIAIVLFAPKFLFFGSIGFAVLTLVLNLLSNKSFKWQKIYTVYASLYMLYVLSLLWTYNSAIGSRDIEYKLLLLAGPIVMAYGNWRIKDFRSLILGFNTVILIALAAALGIYLNCYDPVEGCFSNSNNALGIHPTYMGLYAVFAAILAFYSFLFTKKIWKEFKYLWLLKLCLLGFFFTSSLYVYMVGSKASLISLLLSFGILMLVWLRSVTTNKQFIIALIALGVLGVGVSSWVMQKREFKEGVALYRWYQMDKQAFKNRYRGTHWRQIESNTARILVWDATQELIAEYPLGVGPGDVNDMLFRKYDEEHFKLLKEKKLNPHNQFFQIFLGLGIIGFSLYCVLIGYSFVQSFKRKFPLLGVLAFVIFLNSMFESILEIQLGIFFLVFFSLIFDQLSKNKVLSE